jgi:hypothetical protein
MCSLYGGEQLLLLTKQQQRLLEGGSNEVMWARSAHQKGKWMCAEGGAGKRRLKCRLR